MYYRLLLLLFACQFLLTHAEEINVTTKDYSSSYQQAINNVGLGYVANPGDMTLYDGFVVVGVKQTSLSWSSWNFNTTIQYSLIPVSQAYEIEFVCSDDVYSIGDSINGEKILAISKYYNLPYTPSATSCNSQYDVWYYFTSSNEVATNVVYRTNTLGSTTDTSSEKPSGVYYYKYCVQKKSTEKDNEGFSYISDFTYIKNLANVHNVNDAYFSDCNQNSSLDGTIKANIFCIENFYGLSEGQSCAHMMIYGDINLESTVGQFNFCTRWYKIGKEERGFSFIDAYDNMNVGDTYAYVGENNITYTFTLLDKIVSSVDSEKKIIFSVDKPLYFGGTGNGSIGIERFSDRVQIKYIANSGGGYVLLGDMNNDGILDVTDAVSIISAYINNEEVDANVADVNVDKTVDVSDAIAIIDKYLNERKILIEQISLSSSNITLKIGDTAILTETVLPTNASVQRVIWSSSDSSIATVSQSGEVTAIAEGSCTITCTANDGSGVFASCAVVVSNQHNYTNIDLADFTLMTAPESGETYSTPLCFTKMLLTSFSSSSSNCYIHIDNQSASRSEYLVDFTSYDTSYSFLYNGGSSSTWYDIYNKVNMSSSVGTTATFRFTEFTLVVTKTDKGILFEYSVPMYIHSMQPNFSYKNCYLQ